MMHRLFVDNESDIDSGRLTKNHSHFHHMTKVIKLRVRQRIELCVPHKQVAVVEITAISKQDILFKPLSRVDVYAPSYQITICQSLPKGEKMTTLLKMCTELGVQFFQPLQSDLSVVVPKNMDDKQQRWQTILETAAMQSKQPFIPSIHPLQSLEAFIQEFPSHPNKVLIALNEHETQRSYKDVLSSCRSTISSSETQPHIYVLIGPEGGWSEKEVQLFKDHEVMSATIGDTLLRTEHAGFFAASCIKYEALS